MAYIRVRPNVKEILDHKKEVLNVPSHNAVIEHIIKEQNINRIVNKKKDRRL